MRRWWWTALGAAGFLAGRAWPAQEPDGHWIARNGADWRRWGHEAQTAYAEGFLAGAAFGQAAGETCPRGCTLAADSAGLTDAMARLRKSGGFRLPYGSNVYASRISDFYWWENQRPLPTWYAFWEVNARLSESP
jgi:hypothetical protein